MSTLLAIESSCDDTAAAVICDGRILSNVVSSQAIHQQLGGVVPELASRAHQTNIVPVVEKALADAGLTADKLDAVACTQGPGLLGSLMVGFSFAKAMALGLDIPLIGVNHLQAHLAAHFIEEPVPKFPFLCLLVSGGHTQIVRMDNQSESQIMGSTLDDAAGEAFDKAAKVLGLPYPGGPFVDKLGKDGNPDHFKFKIPEVPGLNYSFSGLKTALLYFLKDMSVKDSGFIQKNLPNICASYQYAIVSYLLQQLEKASKLAGINQIGISGGVAANSYLRHQLKELAASNGWETYIPKFEYCTDNAAMIAKAGEILFNNGIYTSLDAAPYARG